MFLDVRIASFFLANTAFSSCFSLFLSSLEKGLMLTQGFQTCYITENDHEFLILLNARITAMLRAKPKAL